MIGFDDLKDVPVGVSEEEPLERSGPFGVDQFGPVFEQPLPE